MIIKSKLTMPLGFALGLLLVVFAMTLLPSSASAAGKTNSKKTNNTSPNKQAADNDNHKPKATKSPTNVGNKAYDYVAQPGDSYTLMARKAVQTFGLHYHVKLSGAQIIYVETNLTQAASSPYLNVGQKVTFELTNVQNWIQKAQKLTRSQLDAWNYYVQFVNFNTDAVGQSANKK